MKIGKTLWVILMIGFFAALTLIISLRSDIYYSDIIFGGSATGEISEDVGEKTASEIKKASDKYKDLQFPDIDISEWRYMVFNSEHVVKDYAPELESFNDRGIKIDARIMANLYQMVMAAQKDGFEPIVALGYVSYTAQQQIINAKATELAEEKGISFAEARKLAERKIELPGTCEHQTGLAVDITDKLYEDTDYPEMDPELYKWLDEHCHEYGFIKRYPADKKTITGRDEPWHYRYVGKTAAEFIYENGLCLEEFTAHYNAQK